jgi:predicted NBD/HSP70 family sugar kinase
MRIILTDLNSRLLKQRFSPLYNHRVEVIIESLSNGIGNLCQDIPEEHLIGIGIAVPGIVNPNTGVVTQESPLGWQDIHYSDQIREKINKPIVLTNRTHAAALGEYWSGNLAQVSDFLYIRLGSSVEAGIIVDGKLQTGSTFSSGAIGHMTLNPNGDSCTCGNTGCLNTVIGSQALLSTTRNLLKENRTGLLMGMLDGNPSFLNIDHLIAAIGAGDGLALKIIADAGRSLGVIIASLVNFLNFQRVVIGGQLSSAGPALLSPIEEEVNKRALPTSLVTFQIELTSLGEAAAAIGAAGLLLKKISS